MVGYCNYQKTSTRHQRAKGTYLAHDTPVHVVNLIESEIHGDCVVKHSVEESCQRYKPPVCLQKDNISHEDTDHHQKERQRVEHDAAIVPIEICEVVVTEDVLCGGSFVMLILFWKDEVPVGRSSSESDRHCDFQCLKSCSLVGSGVLVRVSLSGLEPVNLVDCGLVLQEHREKADHKTPPVQVRHRLQKFSRPKKQLFSYQECEYHAKDHTNIVE